MTRMYDTERSVDRNLWDRDCDLLTGMNEIDSDLLTGMDEIDSDLLTGMDEIDSDLLTGMYIDDTNYYYYTESLYIIQVVPKKWYPF